MKIQDIFFLIIFLPHLGLKSFKLSAVLGLLCLLLAAPLFQFHIFFTAERLIWYASCFFLASALIALYRLKLGK